VTREASIEGYLRARVSDVGGLCVKMNPAGLVGIPDRLVVLPGGRVAFVEVKKPRGGVVGKAQFVWRDRLLGLGVAHRFVFTREDVDELMEVLR
jgi:hypothetical protein